MKVCNGQKLKLLHFTFSLITRQNCVLWGTNVLHLYKLGSSCVEFILLFCKQLTNFGDIKVNFHRQWNPDVFVFKCSFRFLELLTHCAILSCVRFVLDCCTIEKPYVGLLRKRIPFDLGVSWPYIVDKKNYEKIKFALTFPLSCKWLQNIRGSDTI